jgi:protein TonB
MNTQEFKTATFNDIIFEHRNKQYGAYAIRNQYETAMRKATVSAVALFLLLICVPLLAAKLYPENKETGTTTTYDPKIFDFPPKTPPKALPKPPAPLPPQAPKQTTFKYVAPVIVKDNTPIAKDDNLTLPPDDAIAAIKTQTGTQTGAISGTEAPNGDNTTITDELPLVVVEKPKTTAAPVDTTTYTVVMIEQQPTFPDGEAALFKYLANNLKYPAMARESSIEGTVYVQFTIAKDGSITGTKVLRGIGGGCNEEAMRVINAMPNWKPGRQQGNAVKVKYTLPIKFRLQ